MDMTLISFITIIIACATIIVESIIYLIYQHKKQKFYLMQNKYDLELNKLKMEEAKFNLEYSNSILEYIRNSAAQITTLKFKEYKDHNSLDVTNRQQLSNLIKETINLFHEGINMKNIDYDRLVFDSKYLDNYCIKTVIYMMNEKWDKEVENM